MHARCYLELLCIWYTLSVSPVRQRQLCWNIRIAAFPRTAVGHPMCSSTLSQHRTKVHVRNPVKPRERNGAVGQGLKCFWVTCHSPKHPQVLIGESLVRGMDTAFRGYFPPLKYRASDQTRCVPACVFGSVAPLLTDRPTNRTMRGQRGNDAFLLGPRDLLIGVVHGWS